MINDKENIDVTGQLEPTSPHSRKDMNLPMTPGVITKTPRTEVLTPSRRRQHLTATSPDIEVAKKLSEEADVMAASTPSAPLRTPAVLPVEVATTADCHTLAASVPPVRSSKKERANRLAAWLQQRRSHLWLPTPSQPAVASVAPLSRPCPQRTSVFARLQQRYSLERPLQQWADLPSGWKIAATTAAASVIVALSRAVYEMIGSCTLALLTAVVAGGVMCSLLVALARRYPVRITLTDAIDEEAWVCPWEDDPVYEC